MLSAQKKSRNYFIELLRFFFAVLILLYHGLAFLAPDSSFLRCTNGAVAVEFFFILSGFLMANSAKKKIGDTANIGKDSVDFIKKKYLSVFPYHLFSYVCSFIVAVILGSLTVVGAVKLFVNSLPNLFMLDMVGLPYTMVAGYVWFVSAMLIAMAVLYPILRRWFSVFTNIIAPVLGVLLLGWLAQTYGRLTYISFWTGLTFKGVLRAVAEIAFGCAAFALCERLKERDFTKFGKLVLSLLELFGYAATFVYAFSRKSETFYFYLVFFLTVSIAVSFSGQTLTSHLRNNKLISFLGKLSLPVYLNQYYVYLMVERYTKHLNGNVRLLLFAGISLVMPTICLVLVDFLRKKINISKLLVQKTA